MRKLQAMLTRLMQGRNGMDNLAITSLWTGLILSAVDLFLGTGVLRLLGLALYVYSIFRMMSRNTYKRAAENKQYVQLSMGWKTKLSQFVMRLKNSKTYKYFKCPQCRVMLRLKRGCGLKVVHCPKCGHDFQQKA